MVNRIDQISERELSIAHYLANPIDYLELDTREYNALRRWGIKNIYELVDILLNGKIVKVRNLGTKSIEAIKHKLDKYLEPFATRYDERNEDDGK